MADLKVKVGLDRSGFTTGLASMENSVKGFGTKVGGILAGAFAFDSIISGFTNAIAVGDRLQDLANRFGLSASSLQEIGNAASLAGGSLEDVASAMNKLAKNAGEALGDSGGEIAQAFARIGVSAEDLKSMNPQELFMALSKAVASGSLGLEAFAVAQKLAGRGAASLMETLAMGPAAITANGQAMGVFSDETIAALSKAQDAITTLQNQFTMIFGNIAAAIVPAIDMFKMFSEQIGFALAATGAFLTGNFKDAVTIAGAGRAARRDSSEQKNPSVQKVATGGMGDERSDPPLIDKAAETSKNKLKAAEDRLADAVRDRESLSMGNSEKLARAQAELIALKIEEFNIADKTLEKVKAQEEIERKKIEVIGLQNDIKEEVRTADKDFLRASKSNDLDGMQEANERTKRLERENKARGNAADFDPRQALMDRFGLGQQLSDIPEVRTADKDFLRASKSNDIDGMQEANERTKRLERENKARGNAADFDPRQALMDKFGLGKQLSDIPASTEAQKTQPVRLENPPNLQGIMDKLDALIKNAGVFS